MQSIALFGATGSLGSHVARQAIEAGHPLSVFVRSPQRLAAPVASAATVTQGDVMETPLPRLAEFASGKDALISCAGLVTEGPRFVELFDRIVSAVESLPPGLRPRVCWFLAGAGLLDLDPSGRRGLDLPKVRTTYWPHRANFERLQRSSIEWCLLCPGPMVEGAPVGVGRLRTSIDGLPAPVPAWAAHLPGLMVLPFFVSRIPEMIIPYADAAAFMLASLAAGGPMTHKRIGLALPPGMKGTKEHYAARPRSAG